MADFCLKCWNEINGTDDPPSKYIISEDLSLCEACGKLTHVIIMERKRYYLEKFKLFCFPVKIVYTILCVLWRIIKLPYLIYKYRKKENNQGNDL